MFKDRKIVSIVMNGQKVRSFKHPVTKNKLPKLYVVKSESKVIYVGVTSQSIRNRLIYGLNPQGKSGYHGYKWKDDLSVVDILIWYFPQERLDRIEAIEAELVYLLRQHTGKWPKYQMEIHFHDASKDEIKIAESIFKECARVD
jgi:predicted GIY-YIG superfamily endonuclease